MLKAIILISLSTLAVSNHICNGIFAGDQICDDGLSIVADGNGCSANCTIENGYQCNNIAGQPSTCTLLCGNRRIDTPTNCDGQGGTKSCLLRQISEQCDNGNTQGCFGCVVQRGFTCQNNQQGQSICTRIVGCGNFIQEQGQQCDNGGFIGCTSCNVESGFRCVGSLGTVSHCARVASCGNGRVQRSNQEQCDDQNIIQGDGCNSQCLIESGWDCNSVLFGSSSICFRVRIQSQPQLSCGNGLLEAAFNEQCDDGNNVSGDGCSSFCSVEAGFRCMLSNGKSVCISSSVCSNRRVQFPESCDDGNQIFGDGCSPLCQIELGHVCVQYFVNSPSVCFKTCGDGFFESRFNEQCDDGNNFSNDGCSSNCKIEARAFCPFNIQGQTSRCSRFIRRL